MTTSEVAEAINQAVEDWNYGELDINLILRVQALLKEWVTESEHSIG